MKTSLQFSVLRQMVLFLLFLAISARVAGQTLNDYMVSSQSGVFSQIKGSGGETSPILSGGTQDDGQYNSIPLGFTLSYLGTNYTHVCASTNGFLLLAVSSGVSLLNSFNTNNLASNTERPLVAPLWDDLLTPLGNFSYKTVGTAGNRIFTAEWLNVQWYFNGNVDVISFQAKIYEAIDRIDFVYRQEANIPSGGVSASIGITSVGTGTGNFISLDGTGPNPGASMITETNTIATRPASGQVYTFFNTNGLKAWYPFKNGSVSDSSGSGNHGVSYYAVPAMDRFGKPNNAFYFNGTNAYLDCGNGASINFTSAATLSAWIKPDTLAGRILSKRAGSGGYELDIYSSSRLRFSYNGTEAAWIDISAYVNKWIYVVATFDGTYSKLYVNAVGTSPVATPLINAADTSHLTIGKASWTSTYPFKGFIDDVRLYNRALSDAEILSFYQEGGYDPTVIASYSFTNGSLLDASGNGNTGVNHKATLTADRFGNPNCAYEFKKVDTAYIDCGNSTSLNNVSSGLTMSVWVNMYSDSIGRIISKTQYGGPPYGGYEMGISQHQLFFGFHNTSYTYTNSSAHIRQWIHLVGTYDGSIVKLYMNGQLVSTFSYATTIGASSNNMLIGAMANKADPGFFTGAIDDIKIYNRALTQAEIVTLFTEGGWSTPATPQIQAIDIFGGTARLSWQSVGGTVAWYNIYRGKDSTNLTLVDSVAGTLSTDIGILKDTVYYYRICAVDASYRLSAMSFAMRAQMTSAPKNFSSLNYSDINSAPLTSDIINGSANQFNHIPKGQIVLYRTKLGRYGKFQILQYGSILKMRWVTYDTAGVVYSQGSSLNVRASFICDLDEGKEVSTTGDFWWHQVSTINRRIEPSTPALFTLYDCDTVFTPMAPANLKALAGNAQIGLVWNQNTEVDFLQYKIFRKIGFLGLYSQIKTTTGGVTDTAFVNTGLTNGQLYFYRITATDSAGLESGYSNAVGATPNAPPTLLYPLDGAVGIAATDSVKWTAVTGATLYNVQIGTASDFSGGITVNDTVSTTVHWIGPTIPSEQLYWHVKAIDGGGANLFSAVWGFTTAATVPSLSATPLSLSFGYVPVSTTSIEKSYSVYGSNLTPVNGSISVSAPTGFEITKTSGSGYTTSTSVSYSGNNLSATPIYVRFAPTSAGNYNSGITHSGGGVTSFQVTVTGIGNVAPGTPTGINVTPGNAQVTLKWNKNTDSDLLRYRIYRNTIPLSPILSDSLERGALDTIRIVTGLSNGTLYYFSVTAVDSGGMESAHSSELNVTPISPAPSAPSGLTVQTVSSSSITISWMDNSNDEDSFEIERSVTNNSNFSFRASVAAGITAYQDFNVTSGTNYYYRVRAYKSVGGYSSYSNELFADFTPPYFLTSPYTTGTPVLVGANGQVNTSPIVSASAADAGSGLWRMQVAYRNTSEQIWSYSSYYTISPINFPIPINKFVYNNKPIGVNFRVGVWDNQGNVYWSPFNSMDVQLGPLVTDQPSFSMPTASQFSNQTLAYRVISVPYNLTNKKPSGLLSNFGSHMENNVSYARWRFQQYLNGQPIDYDQISGLDVVTPGSAFFFIVRDGGYQLTVQGASIVRADTMYKTSIPLKSGWNLIGNPFNVQYPVDSLEYLNTSRIGRAYFSGSGAVGTVGGWEISGTNVAYIQPWQGIAIRVSSDGTLKIPSVGQRFGLAKPKSTPSVERSEPVQAENVSNWMIPINAHRADIDMRCDGGSVGMVQGASEGDDQFDVYIPPFVGDKNIAVYSNNSEGEMLRDIRPLNEEGNVWNMRVVTGDAGAKVKLQFGDILNLPNPAFDAYLIDLDQKMAHNLKEVRSLEINSGNGIRNFRVVVGKKSFVAQNNAGVELSPTAMKLYPNYPNPFNPETVIRYTVPNSSPSYTVTLKIFNMLGQEITTLVNERKSSGYYEVKWNAFQQSSGVYFYQITVSDAQQTFQDIKKMVLMK